jgi:hypothetical protein
MPGIADGTGRDAALGEARQRGRTTGPNHFPAGPAPSASIAARIAPISAPRAASDSRVKSATGQALLIAMIRRRPGSTRTCWPWMPSALNVPLSAVHHW